MYVFFKFCINFVFQSPILGRDSIDWVVHFFQYKTSDFLYDLNKCTDDRKYSETNVIKIVT
jgi:hypothetical protein